MRLLHLDAFHRIVYLASFSQAIDGSAYSDTSTPSSNPHRTYCIYAALYSGGKLFDLLSTSPFESVTSICIAVTAVAKIYLSAETATLRVKYFRKYSNRIRWRYTVRKLSF